MPLKIPITQQVGRIHRTGQKKQKAWFDEAKFLDLPVDGDLQEVLREFQTQEDKERDKIREQERIEEERRLREKAEKKRQVTIHKVGPDHNDDEASAINSMFEQETSVVVLAVFAEEKEFDRYVDEDRQVAQLASSGILKRVKSKKDLTQAFAQIVARKQDFRLLIQPEVLEASSAHHSILLINLVNAMEELLENGASKFEDKGELLKMLKEKKALAKRLSGNRCKTDDPEEIDWAEIAGDDILASSDIKSCIGPSHQETVITWKVNPGDRYIIQTLTNKLNKYGLGDKKVQEFIKKNLKLDPRVTITDVTEEISYGHAEYTIKAESYNIDPDVKSFIDALPNKGRNLRISEVRQQMKIYDRNKIK